MVFFLIAVLAGVMTVLAPCILPLLPIVIGSSATEGRMISRRALVVIASLSVSVVLFTLLLKASTLLIEVPQLFWSVFSGTIIMLVGLAIVFPSLWARIALVQKLSNVGNKVMGVGYQKKSYSGDALIGLALGPVFTTCSPTYLFIIATILPAGFLVGFIHLLGFTLGLALSLLLVAYFGGQLIKKITGHMDAANRVKKMFGVLIMLVGVAILTGYDKKLEAAILDLGYGATINFEESLIERFAPKMDEEKEEDLEVITLAGGCFWCTEAYFQEEKGVVDAVSGYVGGNEEDASYLKVSRGDTLHREAVQISYDSSILSTEDILDIYWSHIDPTDATGQFADKGFQYTTAIFYHNAEQKDVALDSKERLENSGLFDQTIVTEVLPFTQFFKAEEYHQDYYKKASEHYERYKQGSGRADFVEETWAKEAAIEFLEQEALN
jgi:peptide methionine sulfoxide reductase msrA/msrB